MIPFKANDIVAYGNTVVAEGTSPIQNHFVLNKYFVQILVFLPVYLVFILELVFAVVKDITRKILEMYYYIFHGVVLERGVDGL